jgi:methyltransferase (TIGR00027 family)
MGNDTVIAGTARWTAAARARESTRPDRLFDDPWAALLAEPDGFAMLAAREPDGVENPFLPVRTRFFDDLILAHSSWVTQIVLLGAGHDTRAVRLPLPDTVTVFALDQPEVLIPTEAVITHARAQNHTTAGWRPVAADLAAPWDHHLLSAGFHPRSPTLWIAEGLLFYLTDAQVHETLNVAANLSQDRAVLAADIFGTGLLELPAMRGLVEHRRAIATPLPYCTDAPDLLLTRTGWTPDHIVEPGQPQANFGRLQTLAHDSSGGANPTLRTYLVIGRTTKPTTPTEPPRR